MNGDLISARGLAIALGAARTGLGVGATLFTRRTLRAAGFREVDANAEALARMGGGRDLVLGALTLAAARDADALRRVTAALVAIDLADAVTFVAAARHESTRTAAIGGVVAGTAAALAGLAAARGLGRP